MRPVQVKRFEWPVGQKQREIESEPASFIQYGSDILEMEDCCSTFSVGICEFADGRVELVPCHHFTFVKE